jgi:ABC-type sugar transport system ATPase subunit
MGIEIIDGSAKGFLNLSGAENFFCEKLRMERAGCRDKKAMRLKAEELFDQLAWNRSRRATIHLVP